jgi:hypothetical protein
MALIYAGHPAGPVGDPGLISCARIRWIPRHGFRPAVKPLRRSRTEKLSVTQVPDPLRAAMMKAGLPVSQIRVTPHRPTGPAADTAVARDLTLPVVRRIRSAERAFRNGLIGVEELSELYRLVPVAGDAMALDDGPKARAQLFQIAERGPDTTTRARALARLLSMARQSATYAAMAAYAQRSRGCPSVRCRLVRAEAFRVLLLAGKRDLASYWLNLAEGARHAPQTTQAVPGMEILAQWVGIAGRYDSDPVEIWRLTTGANEGAAGRLYAVYRALGQPVATAGANSLIGFGSGEGRELADAVTSGRRGETVLRVLVALGGQGLESADITRLTQSIGGLSAVGLQQESRALAVAAGIAAGL